MGINSPRFTEINEEFECRNCGKNVPPASSTCRDHCPYCLFSIHVDVMPGDRAANCGGTLRPISYYQHPKKGYMIEYRCLSCGEKRVNKFLERDDVQADDYDALLALSTGIPL